ncbi:cytochrome c biogenesis protein CcdA [Aurantimonas sp. A2-1-M11]
MDVSLIPLALGLGLLGFIEPCTIGAHMLFLGAQRARPMRERLGAVVIFVVARLLVMGGFGGLIVFLGQELIGAQTGFWLIFGLIYLLIGGLMLGGFGGRLRRRIRIASEAWRTASNPILQGVAFGLNIPACAAPILFALIGVATTTGSVLTGFSLMAIFALALSLPLLPLSAWPVLARPLDRLADWLRPRRAVLGVVFIALGLWSVWFGLFVDPADWAGT